MNKSFVKNFLDGAGSVLVLFSDQGYIYPSKSDFKTDSRNLAADARNLAIDMNKTIRKRNGKTDHC
jgi:hypothetical protein